MDDFEDPDFYKREINLEESFWIMYYFLKLNHDLSDGTFEISDILSVSSPVKVTGMNKFLPADGGMIHLWNEAYEIYIKNGRPDLLDLKK